jgi:hypothetical protein
MYIVWLPHTYSLHAVPPGDERAFYVNSIAHPLSPYTRQKRELQFTASGYVLYAPRPTMLHRCGDRGPLRTHRLSRPSGGPQVPTSPHISAISRVLSQYKPVFGHKVISC